MKRSIILVAIAAICLTACEPLKNEDVTPESSPVKFTATIESASTTAPVETKTALEADGSAYNVVWRSGDQIAIKNGVNGDKRMVYSTTSTTDHADFTFVSGDSDWGGPYAAVYPADYWTTGNPAYPMVQEYVPGNIASAPMFAHSSGTHLQFFNLGGIIRINLKTNLEGQKIKMIYLYSEAQSLSGNIINVNQLEAASEPVAAVVEPEQPYHHPAILDCGNDGVEIGPDPTPFHIAVPANTYTDLQITVITSEGIKQDFKLKADKSIVVDRSRIANITLTFNTSAEVIDLSAKATANTYIVSAKGTYKFKATVKGNGGLDPVTGTVATGIDKNDIDGAVVLWELKSQGLGINYDSKMKAYDLYYHDGYVYFNTRAYWQRGAVYVAIFKDKNGGTDGVYDKNIDEILWSWLIWSTSEPETVLHNGMSFMDRNLGSLYEGTFDEGYKAGFSYQWGRPYPFSSAYNHQYTPYAYVPQRTSVFDFPSFPQGTTVEYSVAHPTSFFQPPRGNWMSTAAFKNNLWADDAKTIYDPSPIGFKVPTKAQLSGITSSIAFYGAGFIGTCGSDFGYGNPSSVLLWSSTCDDYNTVWANTYGSINYNHVDTYFRSGMQIRPVEDETTFDPDEYVDLSESATANSYIVPDVGDYKFRADVRGNGASDLAGVSKNISESEIYSAEVLWASYGTSIAPAEGELIRKVRYEDGYVFFSTGRAFKEGNAVVAIKNAGGTILWSWHIWFTDDDIEASAQTYPGGAVFMDRNLGALAVTDASATSHYGLLYQWGRKDPFLNSKSNLSGDIQPVSHWTPALRGTAQGIVYVSSAADLPTAAAVVQTPNNYIYYYNKGWCSDLSATGGDFWGEDKTIFDPCPQGWKIPSSGHFDSSFREAYSAAAFADPLVVSTPSAAVYIPNAGLRSTKTMHWRYSSNGYQYLIRNSGIVVKPEGYHFRFWASDGVLINDRTSLSNTKETKGFFSYAGICNGEPYIEVSHYTGSYYYSDVEQYPVVALGSGLSVRCVRESCVIVHPTGISISHSSATLSEDQTLQLVASTIPANAAIPGITFSSTDPAIASVSESGLVTAHVPGTCQIIATADDNGVTATCNITVSATQRMAVDLGLPSGTKWANINLGAASTSAAGDLYKWGETVPNEAGTPYKWGNRLTPTKYNSEDGLAILQNNDDAAYVNWGTRWHIPSIDEWNELKNNCNVETVQKGDVRGRQITSRINSAQIFLPEGKYWTNSLDWAPAYGRYLYEYATDFEFSNYTWFGEYSSYRDSRISIRPVYR